MTRQLTSVFVLASTLTLGAQMTQHHANQAMGFDQDKAAHAFALYTDGGTIDVTAKDAKDKTTGDAIRKHLMHVVQMFNAGNFETPMAVHQTKVPGTEEMTKHRGAITYVFTVAPAGGRIDIRTENAEALKAVHEFLKFQIADHKTGDSLAIRKR